MRLIFLILGLLFLSKEGKSQPSWCQLKGTVFVEKDPSRAQFRVYMDDSETFADMLVFRAENHLFADKPGNWFFSDIRAQANFFIIFVNDRSKADFSIHFIDTESFSGCQSSR